MSVGNLNGRWAVLFKLSVTVGTLMITLGVGAQAWIIQRLSGIDEKIATVNERISVVESNRFTSKDGLEVWGAVSQIREQLARVPSEIPPQWLIEKVNRMEARVQELSIQQAAMQASKRR